jgi:hypothetical protein
VCHAILEASSLRRPIHGNARSEEKQRSQDHPTGQPWLPLTFIRACRHEPRLFMR